MEEQHSRSLSRRKSGVFSFFPARLSDLSGGKGRAPVQRQSPYQLRFVWGVITAPGREAFLQVGGGEAAGRVWGCRVCVCVSPPMICEPAHMFRSIRGRCAVCLSACAHTSHLCVTVCPCVGTEQIRSAQETKGRGVDVSLGLSFLGDAWSPHHPLGLTGMGTGRDRKRRVGRDAGPWGY